jgi:hypothetical protein
MRLGGCAVHTQPGITTARSRAGAVQGHACLRELLTATSARRICLLHYASIYLFSDVIRPEKGLQGPGFRAQCLAVLGILKNWHCHPVTTRHVTNIISILVKDRRCYLYDCSKKYFEKRHRFIEFCFLRRKCFGCGNVPCHADAPSW